MAKFLLLLKQYGLVAVAGIAIGGLAVSTMSGDDLLGAADGKRNIGGSVNDLFRDAQKKGKKAPRANREAAPAPTREDLGVGDFVPEDVFRPVVEDAPLLDPRDPEQCARHNSSEGSSHPYTSGEVRRVRYLDMNHYYGGSNGAAIECLIAVYAKGCDGFTYYSVVSAANPDLRFGDVSRNLCQTAEKALLNKTPVAVSGVVVPVNGVTPNAVHKKLLSLELSANPIK